MSSKPFVTEEDVATFLQGKKKDKPDNVPTIRFDVPPLTTDEIVKSVSGKGGPWRTLQDVYRESIEEKRAKKLSDRYDMTPIPVPDWDSEDL